MEDKRSRIHKAALDVFASNGFHETTVAEIALRAGVAKGTIYLYFASKADILIDVFRGYLDEILDFVDGLLDSAMSAPEILAAFVEKQKALLQQEPNLIRVLSRRSLQALSDGDEKMAEFNKYLLERISKVMKRAKEMGELRPFDIEMGACVLLAMQEALPLYVATFGRGDEERAAAHASQQLSQFMWASVQKETA